MKNNFARQTYRYRTSLEGIMGMGKEKLPLSKVKNNIFLGQCMSGMELR